MKKYNQLQQELQTTKLIIVSKKRSEEEILTYYNLGHRDFGENRVDELITKYNNLPKDINWHFIGHLQRNKAAKICSFIHTVQSVTSLKLAKILNTEAQKHNRIINILVEVNFAQEETKSGLAKADIHDFIKQLTKFSQLNLQGIMCIGPHTTNPELIEQSFKEASTFQKQLQTEFSELDLSELSMGMSNDYQIALKHHSTMVRLGSCLFK